MPKRNIKLYMLIGIPILLVLVMVYLIHLQITNAHRSWGSVQISDNGNILLYNGRTYKNDSEHLRTETHGRKLGAKGETRTSFYEIPGMESAKWLAVQDDELAFAFIYKEVNVTEISLEEFSPTAVEFNENGKKIRDPETVSKVITMIETNAAFNTLDDYRLIESNITSIELYSDKYPSLIYLP
ncbi:hypothetical protein SAMN04487895_101106 [Paenibacillus sophorae]|uniref:Uncharacterized protein n=1 Tax=Paenibacillus sophorae TaxID=1333845 RepID=A0A1H8FG75_9BACL|nr:hypothetical protein [Paenibacillus sophorae]QWU13860.1 hypothetical protein KP014_18090 [Paenibacillus sophorae]SEN30632.1 hypothetical protein SAMN04487895_101106 [Paenibacillus sophorae]